MSVDKYPVTELYSTEYMKHFIDITIKTCITECLSNPDYNPELKSASDWSMELLSGGNGVFINAVD